MQGRPVVDIDLFRLLDLMETVSSTQLVHHYLVRLTIHSTNDFDTECLQISHFGDTDALKFPTRYIMLLVLVLLLAFDWI